MLSRSLTMARFMTKTLIDKITWRSNSEHLALKSAACRQKRTCRYSPELIRRSLGFPGFPGSATWTAARNPPSLAPRARMT